LAAIPSTISPMISRALLYCALLVAGLTGNYFNYPIFLNIDFLFGSIFAMLALQFFGYGQGVAAATIIAGYTYLLWNHPYAIIIMAAEVAVVGWLMGRRKMGMVLSDTFFWFIFGMPLIYLFYHVIMQVPLSNTYIVMTKQAVNGIANALMARLIFSGYVLRSHTSLISYREIVYNLLAFFVLCPALIVLALESRTDFNETDLQIRTSLIQNSRSMDQRLEAWLESRKTVIVFLAKMAASRSPQQMQSHLEQAKHSDVSLVRIGLLDSNAATTAYAPLIDELGRSNIGRNFADRPFIPMLKQTLKPMLSEVMIARIGTPKPLVAVLAPVVIAGEYGGFVSGVLDLEPIRDFLDKSMDSHTALYTLLDKNGNVIMTNRRDQTVMSPFERGQGTLNRIDNGIRQWVPDVPPNTPLSERGKKSFYVAETVIGNLAEWNLLMEQPVAPFQKHLTERYTNKLTLLFMILLITMLIAELLSRRIATSLEQLHNLTNELPSRLEDHRQLAWPESAILEAKHLINNFRLMADMLSAQSIATRQINESLEQQVEERTQQTRKLSQEQQIILNTLSVGVSLIKDRVIFWTNPAHDRILGYENGETQGRNTSLFYADRQQYEHVGREGYATISNGEVYCTDATMKRQDGSLLLCNIMGSAVNPDNPADGSIWVLQDISERKRAEEALQESEECYHTLFSQANDGIFVMTVNGKLVEVNESFARMHGYTAQEMQQMSLEDIDTQASSQEFSENLRRLTSGEILAFEVEHIHKDGHVFTLDVSASMLSFGGESYILAFHRDITERKRTEEALYRAKETAVEANEAKSRFLATVAHEFRTPLSLLISSSDILKNYEEHLSSNERAEQIENIQSAAQQMAELIDTVISFNRVGADRHTHSSTPLDIGQISRVIAGEVKTVWCGGQKFHPVISADCGTVLLNEGLYRRVVENLLSNAFRYTLPDGTITLAVSRKRNRLLVVVTDSGIGIPAEDQGRIFEAFYRGGNVDKQRGLGLGLSIACEALAQLGGNITFSSAPGDGTTMRVDIPVVDAAATGGQDA